MQSRTSIVLLMAGTWGAGCGWWQNQDPPPPASPPGPPTLEIGVGERFAGELEPALTLAQGAYALERRWRLEITESRDLRLRIAPVWAICPEGSGVSGPYLTLESQDGRNKLSSLPDRDGYLYMPVDFFPGRLPPNTYELTVIYAAQEPCQIEAAEIQLIQAPRRTPPSPPPPPSKPPPRPPRVDYSGIWVSIPATKVRLAVYQDSFELSAPETPETAGTLELTPTRQALATEAVFITPDVRSRCTVLEDPRWRPTQLSLHCDRHLLPTRQTRMVLGAADGSLPRVHRFSTASAIRIPDGDPRGITQRFAVVLPGRAAHLEVELVFDHAYAHDLRVQLTHPSGTRVTLVDRPTGSDLRLLRIARADPRNELGRLLDRPVRGQWVIHLADLDPGDAGSLTSLTWTVSLDR